MTGKVSREDLEELSKLVSDMEGLVGDLTRKDDFGDRHKGAAETYQASKDLDDEAKEIQREHRDWSYEKCLGKARENQPELTQRAFPPKGL